MKVDKNLDITSFHLPRWNELPNIDLYLDQVVNLINSTLEILNFDENNNGKLLTKSMINNYVKNGLVIAPEKKLYSRVQLAKLFVICVLKQVYSMNEIKELTEIALKDSSIEETYDTFCNLFEESLTNIFANKQVQVANENKKLYMIKSILVSISYKIYVQSLLLK